MTGGSIYRVISMTSGWLINGMARSFGVIAVIEKHIDGRWHYHAAIEPPQHLSAEAFETLIRDCWHKTDWGYPTCGQGTFHRL
jgi:hypothetical protein